ncbi:ferric uptake regulator family protein [Pseudomonas citronellolis]|uniref:ferric uptake regulator family protein n=1 Tax=Pseudomonas citronellolis TaxID=53408 RepID=UPI0023E38AD9|nr:ferric uptake regulator family protein [Pseudomonas citronellolis]MDF3936211.1 ferric uptake regulator family protein [Pseudomonas citronellolis]
MTLRHRLPEVPASPRVPLPSLAVRREQRPARQLLENAGLRCSLPRLKLLDVLCGGAFYSVATLFAMLNDEIPLVSRDCVRQTLRRLHASGLLLRDAQGRYGLDPEPAVAH